MSKKPNVLFIITDQQYAGAMSCAGNPDLETPAMDGLNERGVRFEKAYCTQPLCAPCRASFITGLMPHQTGVVGNKDPLAPELKDQAMGHLLRAAGYDCGYAGKWHIQKKLHRRFHFIFSQYFSKSFFSTLLGKTID